MTTETTPPADGALLDGVACSAFWPLWKHMADNHALTLLDSECADIIEIAREMLGVRFVGDNACEVVGFDGTLRTVKLRFDEMPCVAIGDRWLARPMPPNIAPTQSEGQK